MQAEPNDLAVVERAVVLHLLRDDHAARWTRPQLVRAMKGIEPATVEEAVRRLVANRVVLADETGFRASRCVRRLDVLGLIAV